MATRKVPFGWWPLKRTGGSFSMTNSLMPAAGQPLLRTLAFCAMAVGAMLCLTQQVIAAEVEFCPATVAHITAFHAALDDRSPAFADTLFGITLRGQHARSVATSLVVYTDDASYAVKFPSLPLRKTTHPASVAGKTVSITTYDSDPVFIRFDRPTPVRYLWVSGASAGKEKPVSCPTQPSSNDRSAKFGPFTTPVPDLRLDALVRSTTRSEKNTFDATLTGKLTAPTCSQPNQEPRTVTRIMPEFPEIARQQGLRGTTTVKVEVDSTGKTVGSSVYASSGSKLLDDVALSAAAANAYAPATFMCVPIVGSYLFVVDFQ